MSPGIISTIVAFIAKWIFKFQYALYLLFVLYTYSFRTTIAYYIRGRGFSKIFAFSGVINAVMLAIFNILFLIKFPLGVSGYLLSIGGAYAVTSVYLYMSTGIQTEIRGKEMPSRKEEISLLKYCVPLVFYNILYWVNTVSGRYILLWYTNEETVGVYVAAIKISAVINALQQAVYLAFQLNASREFSDNKKAIFYSNVCNIISTAYYIFGSVIIVCVPILAKLTLKNDFIIAEHYLPLIMYSSVVNCISSLFGVLYSAYMLTERTVLVSIIGSIVNVVFCVVLIPSVGIWGACIAMFACYLSQMIYKIIDTTKLGGLQIKKGLFISNNLLLMMQVVFWEKNYMIDFQYIFPLALVMINCIFFRAEIREFVRKIACYRKH